jgi:hypothetical protein
MNRGKLNAEKSILGNYFLNAAFLLHLRLPGALTPAARGSDPVFLVGD